MQQDKIKIQVLGLDGRSQNTLSFFFEKFCNGQCEIIEDIHLANVFMINMDSADSAIDLAELKQKHLNQPRILTSIKAIDPVRDYFLRKPLIADHLLQILNELRGGASVRSKKSTANSQQRKTASHKKNKSQDKLTTDQNEVPSLTDKEILAFVGDGIDIDLRQAKQENAAFFDLQHYFIGYVRQAYMLAKQQQSAVIITGLWHPITLFPESNQIYIDMSDRQLKSTCVVTLNSSMIDVDNIKIDSVDSEKQHINVNNINTTSD
ncbi:MAG: hypothetical protein Q9N32_02530 [Gammaproteobacteria bacterium]|nr:hypothetical protein [Gammaproteobacteria bacterium]